MNSHPAERYDLDDPTTIEFGTPTGVIPIAVTRIDVDESVVLFGTTRVGAIDTAITDDAFHLGAETASPAWDPDDPLEVTLRLDPGSTSAFASSDELVTALFSHDATLTSSSSWFALEVMQRDAVPGDPTAEVAFGFRTSWADHP